MKENKNKTINCKDAWLSAKETVQDVGYVKCQIQAGRKIQLTGELLTSDKKCNTNIWWHTEIEKDVFQKLSSEIR